MNVRIVGVILLLAIVGVFVYPMYFMGPGVCEEAKLYAGKVKITVYIDGSPTSYTCGVSSENVKVLHYHEGGKQLAVRPEVDWQLVLGVEDWYSDLGGDYADVIVKISKTKDGSVKFAVACLGAWRKQVHYANTLKLDTNTGKHVAEWSD